MRYTISIHLADKTWEEMDTDEYPKWSDGLLEINQGSVITCYPVLNVRKFMILDREAESGEEESPAA